MIEEIDIKRAFKAILHTAELLLLVSLAVLTANHLIVAPALLISTIPASKLALDLTGRRRTILRNTC